MGHEPSGTLHSPPILVFPQVSPGGFIGGLWRVIMKSNPPASPPYTVYMEGYISDIPI